MKQTALEYPYSIKNTGQKSQEDERTTLMSLPVMSLPGLYFASAPGYTFISYASEPWPVKRWRGGKSLDPGIPGAPDHDETNCTVENKMCYKTHLATSAYPGLLFHQSFNSLLMHLYYPNTFRKCGERAARILASGPKQALSNPAGYPTRNCMFWASLGQGRAVS